MAVRPRFARGTFRHQSFDAFSLRMECKRGSLLFYLIFHVFLAPRVTWTGAFRNS